MVRKVGSQLLVDSDGVRGDGAVCVLEERVIESLLLLQTNRPEDVPEFVLVELLLHECDACRHSFPHEGPAATVNFPLYEFDSGKEKGLGEFMKWSGEETVRVQIRLVGCDAWP